MNKIIATTIAALLVIFLSIILYFNFSYIFQKIKRDFPNNSILYQDSDLGFTLLIPKYWEGKYKINKEIERIDFIYVKNIQNPISKQDIIFSIYALPKEKAKEIISQSEFSGREIYSDDKLSFVAVFTNKNPYNNYPQYQKEAKEFQEMLTDVQKIIETFSFDASKIICAKEGEKVNRNPFFGLTIKKCCEDLIEWRESKSYSICLKPISEGIQIENPTEIDKIKNPLKITGKAKKDWFFEAEFKAELYDENDNFLGSTILTAKESQITENFIPFEGILNFSKPETSFGKLRFLSLNFSKISEKQKIYEIRVQFDNNSKKEVLLYYYNPLKDKDKNGNIKCSKDGLEAIKREVSLTNTPIQDVINLLLKGKENLTEEDVEKGITTEYPLDGFKLKSANLKENGTLVLEFEDPKNKTIGGSCRVAILWFQIEATAKQFPEVKEVKFLPETLFQP
ncbi:MAG: Gmad2 immunoglobulin-like domain-containing protein [Minisyncoccia bacterium]